MGIPMTKRIQVSLKLAFMGRLTMEIATTMEKICRKAKKAGK